jgi:type II secretory pathway pseudopilin PulG
MIMKRYLSMLAVTAVIALPGVSQAQVQSSLTRAQVQNELRQLRQAGYSGDDEATYPSQIQAAERRVAAERQNNASGYGATSTGTSASGSRVDKNPWAGESDGRINP